MSIEELKAALIVQLEKNKAREEAHKARLASLPAFVPTDCKKDGHSWNVLESFRHIETWECAVCQQLKRVYVD
jgi:hypothetical protein